MVMVNMQSWKTKEIPVIEQVPFPSGPWQTLTAEQAVKVASLVLPLGNLTHASTSKVRVVTQNVSTPV